MLNGEKLEVVSLRSGSWYQSFITPFNMVLKGLDSIKKTRKDIKDTVWEGRNQNIFHTNIKCYFG